MWYYNYRKRGNRYDSKRTLAKDENVEITFSTEPGVDFGVYGFFNSEEEFSILLNTAEWECSWQMVNLML